MELRQGVREAVRKTLMRFLIAMNVDKGLRYHEAVSYLRRSGLVDSSILEVGSGPVGITAFLNRRAVGVDLAFDGPSLGLLEQICGSATHLGFEANSFDVIVSVDMLEHLLATERPKAIAEMVRVAKRCVIVIAPCWSAESEAFERRLATVYNRRGRALPLWLSEHLQNGLPTKGEVGRDLQKAIEANDVKRCKIMRGETTNVKLLFLLRLFDSGGFPIYLIGMTMTRILLWLFPWVASRGPCYRTVSIAEFQK